MRTLKAPDAMVNKHYNNFCAESELHLAWLATFVILSPGIKLSDHQHLADCEGCVFPSPPLWKRKSGV